MIKSEEKGALSDGRCQPYVLFCTVSFYTNSRIFLGNENRGIFNFSRAVEFPKKILIS